MKTTVAQVLKKLNVLLTILLCGVLTIALPATVQANNLPKRLFQESTNTVEEAPLAFFLGDYTPGEVVGLPQLERSLLAPLFYLLLQKIYPNGKGAIPAVVHASSASKDDCGLYIIQTKGP
ncbi:hypothetical protein [Pontibacter indicus]|uniref:Uncharacterized protein n=1 Tax=Pontibacter indicus TaxID=1317125 RepID=A0A1R3WV11_9BACT|nr:hypothetical protein [Pontibacter indicus]SIT81873.1 hypothetical protein SAMN05444128_1033 [Pontibacter indicus]